MPGDQEQLNSRLSIAGDSLSRAFILTFSHGNGYQIDFFVVVSGVIFNFCRKSFQLFSLQSEDTRDLSFQRFGEYEKSHPALLQQEFKAQTG